MPTKNASKNKKLEWNLSLLYKGDNDPQIEKDMREIERLFTAFAKEYNVADKKYLPDPVELRKALEEYEVLTGKASGKPLLYFHYRISMDSSDPVANRQMALLRNRLTVAANLLQFFPIAIGSIVPNMRSKLLSDKKLEHFKVFLQRSFDDARHLLSEQEEKIMSLKSQPAYDMWVHGNEKALNERQVRWKGKAMPLSQAYNIVADLPSSAERAKMGSLINAELKACAPFAEAEMNAVVTNKKIDDDLRAFKEPYEATVLSYRNDPIVVEQLVRAVTADFPISQRFYRLKAKMLGKDRLGYDDRAARIGRISTKFTIHGSLIMLEKVLAKADPALAEILKSFVNKGQIDWKPRRGKHGGGFCSSSYGNPTFVLLNHTDTLDSFNTLAHEMGHAIHSELSEKQGPVYSDYSISLAETASTLFEQMAFDAVFETLPDREKVVALEQRISRDISTIHRQIAGFNLEKDIHESARAKGFLSKEELAELNNKHNGLYLGGAVEISDDHGYRFVGWPHLRYFFYMYSYAYGLLVSKALLRRYKQDKSFWKKIEQFLSAGGSDSPENILKSIGVDVTKPDFWKEGLKEIEEDIDRLEKLTRKR